MGGGVAIYLNHFLSGTVTGNKIYAQQSGAYVGTGAAGLASVSVENSSSLTFNNNTYYDQTPKYQGTTAYPFVYAVGGTGKATCEGGNALRFSYTGCAPNGGWKQITGFDANSSYSYAAPTGTEVFVIPNEYEPGRAHIAIYNWALNPTVNVDLSNVLAVGDTYSIYAVENYLGAPVTTGTYNGTPVAIPMTGTTVAAPIGLGWTPASVRPQFGVFVVRKR